MLDLTNAAVSRSEMRAVFKLLEKARKGSLLVEKNPNSSTTKLTGFLSRLRLIEVYEVERPRAHRQESLMMWKTTLLGTIAAQYRTLDRNELERILQEQRPTSHRSRRDMDRVKANQRGDSYLQTLIEKTIGDLTSCSVLDSGWVEAHAYNETAVGKVLRRISEPDQSRTFVYGSLQSSEEIGFFEVETLYTSGDRIRKAFPNKDEEIIVREDVSVYALTRYDGGILTVSMMGSRVDREPIVHHTQQYRTHMRGLILASSETMLMGLMMELR